MLHNVTYQYSQSEQKPLHLGQVVRVQGHEPEEKFSGLPLPSLRTQSQVLQNPGIHHEGSFVLCFRQVFWALTKGTLNGTVVLSPVLWAGVGQQTKTLQCTVSF